MIFKLRTWYKKQDEHGNSIACLKLEIETANTDWRDKIHTAIEKAMAGPKDEPEQKQGAIGFHHSGPEDLV